MIICIVADDGVVGTSTDVVLGVAEDMFDGPVAPILRFAVTAKEYDLSVLRLLTI